MPELAFVMAPEQNWFFRELVAAVREELERQGVPSSLTIGGFPPARPDRVYVLVPPHEYVALQGREALPPDDVLARTIFICAEQPGTSYFDANVELARRAGAVFDINARAARILQGAGIAAEPLALGYTPRWDHFDPELERDVDVVFLGCHSPRRARHLNAYASVLARFNCFLQLSDNSRPNAGGSTTFLTDAKWDLLARTKLLINLHQGDEPYFEWLRAVDAIHCGAVILSEHSSDVAPLAPGRHLFLGHADSLGVMAEALLQDPGRLRRVREEAHEFIRTSRPLSASAGVLAGAARVLVARPVPDGVEIPAVRPRRRDPAPPAPPMETSELATLRRGVKDNRLELLEIRRQVARLEQALRAPDRTPPAVERVYQTRGWRARRASTVTAITALYNHREPIEATLRSLATSDMRSFEVVVVDDGSADGSGDAARAWMREHEDISALLVRHPVNRGLGAARNTALDFARGRYCFVLDADNEVYPQCLTALTWALDHDAGATFAYPILERFGVLDDDDGLLVSKFGWDPERLRHGNFIDALALIRTRELRDLGGYTTDRRLYGWEDYDLWCRIAERGGRGRLVPHTLARYRASPASMLSITNLSFTAAVSAMIERHPRVMAGVTPPA